METAGANSVVKLRTNSVLFIFYLCIFLLSCLNFRSSYDFVSQSQTDPGNYIHCVVEFRFSIWISLVPEIFQDKFQKRHTVNHLPPQKDRARATQKLQSLWSSELSITTCLEDNHMKARAGDFAEGPPAPRTEVWQTLSFCNYFGWRMRQMARVSDTDLVYQVAVTKSICFASALFNKLFILYKKGNFGGKKNKVK